MERVERRCRWGRAISHAREHAAGLRRALVHDEHLEDHRRLGGVEHQLRVGGELLAARVKAAQLRGSAGPVCARIVPQLSK